MEIKFATLKIIGNLLAVWHSINLMTEDSISAKAPVVALEKQLTFFLSSHVCSMDIGSE